MRVGAVIAEYNPFHCGHEYQIEVYRKHYNPDLVIALMSGHFVQRGEPAIIDKWSRAKMALHSGIDLVIELPVINVLQSADYFGMAGVQLATTLGASDLFCGVESGEAPDYLKLAKQWEDALKNSDRTSHYELSLSEWAETFLPEHFRTILNGSNNILAFSYAKAILEQSGALNLVTIKRSGRDYNDLAFATGEFASGTAIRRALKSGQLPTDLHKQLPEMSIHQLSQQDQWIDWESLWPFLKYRLLTENIESLQNIFQMEGGLESRLIRAAVSSYSASDFFSKIKTKRYSLSRLKRLCLYVLLQITKEVVHDSRQREAPIRILGFTENGRKYLSNYLKKQTHLKNRLVTNLGREHNKTLKWDIRAGRLYQLAHPEKLSSLDFDQKPVIIN